MIDQKEVQQFLLLLCELVKLQPAASGFNPAHGGSFSLDIINHPARYTAQHKLLGFGGEDIHIHIDHPFIFVKDRVFECRSTAADILQFAKLGEVRSEREEDFVPQRISGILSTFGFC